MFYMTVSTGIGGAYVYKGELVNGAHSAAAEIYNLIVNEDPYSHHGVNAGAINEQCGGMALARIAGERLGRPMDAPQLFQLARAGHPQARDILDECADNLGKALGNIACVVDPDIFVLGGAIVLLQSGFLGAHWRKGPKIPDPSTMAAPAARQLGGGGRAAGRRPVGSKIDQRVHKTGTVSPQICQ